jgi:Zn-finger nucleic acid-binding protein
MESVTVDGVTVDRCTGCRGIWFDMLEQEDLKKLRAAKKVDIGDPKLGKALNSKRDIECPKCHAPTVKMVVANHPEIQYEACATCYGVFFDAGEFTGFQEKSVLDVFRGLLSFVKK